MKIYLLRHGIAEIGRAGEPDSARALTAEGRNQLRETMKVAKEADVIPSLVISSPYRRAVETAEIAVEVLGYEGRIEKSSQLVPESSPEAVWNLLRENRTEDEVLVVGHQPLFGSATGFLLAAPNLLVDFKKGGIVRIDVSGFGLTPRGQLKWYLTPKLAGC
jgi:phosphohistidine phosphatase